MLVDNMKVLLASSFSLYLKSSNFHWNVEGPNFPQYHEFLADFYSDIYGTVDTTAEYIRALDSYTPGSLTRFQELTIIQDQLQQLMPLEMLTELLADSNKLLDYLNGTFVLATAENQQGIANFLAERIDAMQKHNWMLRSILKTSKM
jgi:starvation-inducible DNA-binding protein